jgi:hypothetical protein
MLTKSCGSITRGNSASTASTRASSPLPLLGGSVSMRDAACQGLTLVHLSAHRESFCGIRWAVSWGFGDKYSSS